jgi:hypothetical protein
MKNRPFGYLACAIAALLLSALAPAAPTPATRHTTLSIVGDSFLINGEPTFKGRTWHGHSVEGLLPNSRMVQGTFDDLNPDTRGQWAYPDTKTWDPERNTREFIAAMPSWRDHGVLGFTLNLQGGSPLGYGNKGWINTAFNEDGTLRPDYFARLERILDRADELGMVPILGLFYFGQDKTLRDEAAVLQATDLTIAWLMERGYRNLIIEICNETTANNYRKHPVLQIDGVPALIRRVRAISLHGLRYPVGVSLSGGELPSPEIVAVSDVILIHGNNRRGVETTPARIREMVAQTRALPTWREMPVVFNEDDHYAFDQPDNNFIAATESRASWGYFDFRRQDDAFEEGFQSVPVDWTIKAPRKQAFYNLAKEIFVR